MREIGRAAGKVCGGWGRLENQSRPRNLRAVHRSWGLGPSIQSSESAGNVIRCAINQESMQQKPKEAKSSETRSIGVGSTEPAPGGLDSAECKLGLTRGPGLYPSIHNRSFCARRFATCSSWLVLPRPQFECLRFAGTRCALDPALQSARCSWQVLLACSKVRFALCNTVLQHTTHHMPSASSSVRKKKLRCWQAILHLCVRNLKIEGGMRSGVVAHQGARREMKVYQLMKHSATTTGGRKSCSRGALCRLKGTSMPYGRAAFPRPHKKNDQQKAWHASLHLIR